jgi:hypothetical protein
MDPRVEKLVSLLKDSVSTHEQLVKLQNEFAAAADRVRSADELRNAIKAFNDKFVSTAKPQTERLAEALKVAPTLEPAPDKPPIPPKSVRILPTDLAKQFRTVIETAQNDARTPATADTAATIKSLEIEMKGFIVVENDQAAIVPPDPEKPIEAGQLSTIRMTFGSIPVLRPAPPDTKK